ncbi:MAG: hypothetical protein M1822_007673 [Bathelium mastoideum]|nr:MAG: hypothetical protein M1822_007673 [Bathelium mastoideum]
MEGSFTNSTLTTTQEKILAGEASPCHFPHYGYGVDDRKEVSVVDVKLAQLMRLRDLAKASEGDFESTLQTAWALLLRCYTGLDEVCFGYREISREASNDECAGEAEDELLTMLPVRMGFESAARLSESVGTAKKSYSQEVQRLHSPDGWRHGLRSLPERRPFNTTFILEKDDCGNAGDQQDCQPLLRKAGTSFGVSITFVTILLA